LYEQTQPALIRHAGLDAGFVLAPGGDIRPAGIGGVSAAARCCAVKQPNLCKFAAAQQLKLHLQLQPGSSLV